MCDHSNVPPPIRTGLDRVLSRTATYVTRLLLIATTITAVSILAGLAALQGGIRIVWIALAAGFAWISIIGLARIRWSISALRRHLDDMVNEIGTLDARDPRRSQEVMEVIEVIEVVDTRQGSTGGTVFSQEFGALRTAAGDGSYRSLPGSATPWIEQLGRLAQRGVLQMMATIFITAVFALLALIFAVALVL